MSEPKSSEGNSRVDKNNQDKNTIIDFVTNGEKHAKSVLYET